MFVNFQKDKFAEEKQLIEESLKEVYNANNGQTYKILSLQIAIVNYAKGDRSITRDQINNEIKSIGDALNLIANSNAKLFNYMINQQTNEFTDLIKKSDKISLEIGENMDALVDTLNQFNRI